MKSMKYGLIALSTIFSLGFSACTEECEYTPAQPIDANCIKASFESDGDVIKLSPTDTKLTINVNREKTDSEHTTLLKVLSATSSQFTIPESVKFAAGASTASFDITFSDIEAEEEYTYSIALDEADVDNYSEEPIASTTGTMILQADWNKSLGEGMFSLSGLGAQLPCEILKANGETWYKAIAPAADGNDIIFKVNADNSVRMKKTPVCMVNVGLAQPVMLYIEINPNYGAVYDPATRTITAVLNYTCSAGALGTFQDVLILPANE